MVYEVSIDRGQKTPEWCVKVRGGINQVEYYTCSIDVVRFLMSQDMPQAIAEHIVSTIKILRLEMIRTDKFTA